MPPVAEQDAPTAASVLSQPDHSTLFMARRSDLRLVKKAITAIRGPEGEVRDLTAGQTIQFNEGVFRVPFEGNVTLTNGDQCDAAEISAWLEKHKLKGDTQEGFWAVDPTAPPISPAETDALVALALALDAEGLRDFIVQESNGWAREGLLDTAKGTLERVDAQLAIQVDALAAARAEGEAAAAKKPAAK